MGKFRIIIAAVAECSGARNFSSVGKFHRIIAAIARCSSAHSCMLAWVNSAKSLRLLPGAAARELY